MDATPKLPREFCIRLTFAPGSPVQTLSSEVQHQGGRALGDGCFAFATERYARIVLEALSQQFDPRFFAVANSETPVS
jgi:hypothetical protein